MAMHVQIISLFHTVLRPSLFNISVNDLQSALRNTNYLLYADHTTIYVTGSDIKSLCPLMNHNLNSLSTWFKANKLVLNVQKKCILFNGMRND